MIFGFSYLFSKYALEMISPLGLLAIRFLFAAIFFELLRLFKIVKIHITKDKIKTLFLIALLQPVLYFIFETYGLFHSTSGEAGITIALIPLFVTLLAAIFLKEKANKKQVFFIILSVIGVIIIQVSNHKIKTNPNMIGFVFLMGAVLSASLYNIFARKSANKLEPMEVTYFMMLLSAFSFNLLYISNLIINNNLKEYYQMFLNVKLIIPIFYLSFFSSIIAFFLVNYSLKNLPAHIAAVYSNIATIVTLTSGYLILHEKFSFYHLLGAVIIIIGVYGTIYFNEKTIVKKIQI